MATQAKSILRYCFSTEIVSRIKSTTQRVRLIPLSVAFILLATGLLPRTYLKTTPEAELRLSAMLSAAADKIRWQRSDIDRILIFSAVILALMILAAQTAIILVTIAIGDAHASGQIFSISPDAARHDIVLIFLDQIFGVPGVFDTGTPGVGSPVHSGIHALLGFYSRAMMIIAVMIVLYHVVVVVGESAQSGTPFGRRFNGLWAPIRLVLALGLLVPLGSGLNAAQYLTLYTAKIGSAFASNAWSVFASRATDASSIVLAPDVRATRDLVKNVFMAEVCRESLAVYDGEGPIRRVQAVESKSALASLANPQAMIQTAKAAGQKSVVISWTTIEPGLPVTENTCGQVGISLEATLRSGTGDAEAALAGVIGPLTEAYVAEVGKIIGDLGDAPRKFADIYVAHTENTAFHKTEGLIQIEEALDRAGRQSIQRVKATVEQAHSSLMRNRTGDQLLEQMVRAGWGGSGIWYVKIGQLNQRFQQAVRGGTPAFTEIVTGADRPAGPPETAAEAASKVALTQAERFVQRLDPLPPRGIQAEVQTDESGRAHVVDTESMWAALKDRPIETALNFVFRTEGLRLLRANPTLDPMVVLVSAGDRMIQSSLVMGVAGLAAGTVGKVVSESWFAKIPFVGDIAKFASASLEAFGAFFVATAMIGFMAGVVLFYLLPLFPFIYFFFAIIGWGLSIVEALCAVPLWALAHLRIDGDGLAGSGAAPGYFILFEIFLRPVLIVAGLIIGYTAFGAGAYLLSTVFDSVTNTLDASMITSAADGVGDDWALGDQGASSGIDNFIYTILFTIIVYGMALSCFKLTDKLPDNIMRWIGPPGGSSAFAGGKDTPDTQGTLLAGAGAVTMVTSGLKAAKDTFGKRHESKKDDPDAEASVRGK